MAARQIELDIPHGMTPEAVALTFGAYLLGARAFEMSPRDNGSPFLYRQGDWWQLDGTNDFWLTVEGTKARIGCRYENEIPALEAMAALFKWRYRTP